MKPEFGTKEVLRLIEENPQMNELNSQFERNEGLAKSVAKDFSDRYAKSFALHERASKVIPLGSQTFSKSRTQYPPGISPLFLTRGEGSKVWDVDGNCYIDFVNSLASITLGYCDPDVTAAVEIQLKQGTIFTLPGTLEMEVAELLVDMIPCAEMVRFGKNGSDVTSAAIRVSRAFTGRDHVAVCGYHGWQDWYIGSTTRNRGVPQVVRDLVHNFTFNDLSSLETIFQQFDQKVAAVILEPMNSTLPKPEFLKGVQELARKNGAVLIFDETITGFRYANGGAQEFFGVIPDLATFGKGIANGYPLSAICGRREIMMLMEEIFFSSTFGGELLSLAASQATLKKLRDKPVVETMRIRGQEVLDGVNALLKKAGVSDVISISGHPAWSFLVFKDNAGFTSMEIKTFFLQEVFARGILTIGTHNLSYSHSREDIVQLLQTYESVFSKIRIELENRSLRSSLRAKPLENLFKIR
jgi:glutamate-1-semialdehyde aminotransferase